MSEEYLLTSVMKEDAKIIEDIRHRLKSGVPESTLYKRSVNEKSEQK